MAEPMLKTDELLKHTAFVRAMARSVLGLDDQVEDAVQETMLAALRQPAPAPGRLRAWLGSIGRRRALDLRRRDKVRVRHERQGGRGGSAPDVAELAARTEIGRTMAAAVLALAPAYRQPVLLRYYEDLPPRVIAAQLSLPVETVRTRIRRGLDQVRQAIEREHRDDPREWRAVLLGWMAPATSVPLSIPVVLLVACALLAVGFGVWSFADRFSAPEQRDPRRAPEVGLDGGAGGAPLTGRADPTSGVEQNGEPAAPASRKPLRIRGVVRDAAGAPVASIPVRYSLDPTDEGDKRQLGDVWTDKAGHYTITGLRPGTLWLALLSQPDGEAGREATLDFRADATHDFTIPPGLVYAGVVEAPGAGPIDLYLDFHEEHPGGLSFNHFKVRRITLDGDRRFGFTGMRQGAYTLVLEGDSFSRIERALDLRQSATGVRIEMAQAVLAKGRVVLVPVLRPARTTIWVRAEDVPQRMIQCEPDGSFEITGARAGDYHVFLRAITESKDEQDYSAIYTERNLTLQVGVAGEPLTIDVAADEYVGLRIVMPRDVPSTKGVVRIHAVGLPDSLVEHVFEAERSETGEVQTRKPGISHAFPPRRIATPTGRFWLTGMPVGVYRLVVRVPGFDEEEQVLDVRGPQDVTFHLRRRDGRMVTSRDFGKYWTLAVRQAGTEKAWETLLWKDNRVKISHRATPGVRHAFLPEGRYEFRLVSLDRAETFLGPITIQTDREPLVLAFEPVPGFSVSGTVRRGGQPVGVLLHVFRRTIDGTWERLEEKEGRAEEGVFRIQGLSRGTYRFSTTREGKPVLGAFEVIAADVTLDLELPLK